MTKLLASLSLLSLALAGCATSSPPPSQLFPGRRASCNFEQRTVFSIRTAPTAYRQGARIGIGATHGTAPYNIQLLDFACTSDWRITGPARLAGDHRSFQIESNAPTGSRIDLSFRVGGQTVTGGYTVIGSDAVVLTGLRSQQEISGCGAREPVRELEFTQDGRFKVTFTPFETYVDYWGTYDFDAATGALRLIPTGSNRAPAVADLEGTARFDEQRRLILEGFDLGHGPGNPPRPSPEGRIVAGSCRYVFGGR